MTPLVIRKGIMNRVEEVGGGEGSAAAAMTHTATGSRYVSVFEKLCGNNILR